MKKQIVLIVALAWCGTQPAQAYFPFDMWQAARAIAKSQWAQASEIYQKAVLQQPTSPEPHYNLGEAQYRQGQFDKSEASFKKAQELGSQARLKGHAAYNLGNTLYREKKLEDALAAYKTALRWNENDDDARYNIQVVLDELNKKKPPPKKDDKDKDKDKDKNKDKNKDKDKGKDKDKDKGKDKDKDKDKGKDKDKDKGKGDKDKEKDKNGKDKDKGKPDQKDKGQPPPPPKADPSQMDKKDAERLLNYFQNRERKNMNDRQQKGRILAPPGVEDW